MFSRHQEHLLSPDGSPGRPRKFDRFKKWLKLSRSRAPSVRSWSPSPAPPQMPRSTTPSFTTAAVQPANATPGNQTQNVPQLSISGAGTSLGKPEDAFTSLSSEDQHTLGPVDAGDCWSVLERLIESTIKKKRQCEEEAWTYTWQGKTIKLSETFDSIFVWVEKFKQIGDIIVQYDPAHSALLWADFRVAVSDSQKRGALLVGIETIANVITRCTIYEPLYLGGSKVTDGLEETLVALYSAALVYLVKAKSYFCQNFGKRVVSAFFNTDEHANFQADGGKEIRKHDFDESELQKYLDIAEAESEDQRSAHQNISDSQVQLRGLLEGLRRPIERIEVKVDEIQDGFQEIRDELRPNGALQF
ncbi:hypothetical protein BDD12DRAFT_907784 [Trichophaea hybrida]|nr:hypothetical protein BDD12DRAFT_907784 [Trichophaea hybrida]